MTLTEFLRTEAARYPGSKIELVYDRLQDGIWVYGQSATARFVLDDAFSNGGQYVMDQTCSTGLVE